MTLEPRLEELQVEIRQVKNAIAEACPRRVVACCPKCRFPGLVGGEESFAKS